MVNVVRRLLVEWLGDITHFSQYFGTNPMPDSKATSYINH